MTIEVKQLAVYGGMIIAPLILIGVFASKFVHNENDGANDIPKVVEQTQGAGSTQAVAMASAAPQTDGNSAVSAAAQVTDKKLAGNGKAALPEAGAPKAVVPVPAKAVKPAGSPAQIEGKRRSAGTSISVTCTNDTAKVFVDADQKGIVSRGKVTIPVSPGQHEIVIKLDAGSFIHTQKIDLKAGATALFKPKFCD